MKQTLYDLFPVNAVLKNAFLTRIDSGRGVGIAIESNEKALTDSSIAKIRRFAWQAQNEILYKMGANDGGYLEFKTC